MTWIDRIFYPSKKPKAVNSQFFNHREYHLMDEWNGTQHTWQWRLSSGEPVGPVYHSVREASWSFGPLPVKLMQRRDETP